MDDTWNISQRFALFMPTKTEWCTTINHTISYTRKLLIEKILNVITTHTKNVFMWGDGRANDAYCGNHFATYTCNNLHLKLVYVVCQYPNKAEWEKSMGHGGLFHPFQLQLQIWTYSSEYIQATEKLYK